MRYPKLFELRINNVSATLSCRLRRCVWKLLLGQPVPGGKASFGVS